MKIADFNGYEMHLPDSGGKAGRGHNRTSTIQVRRNGCVLKQFRFVMDDTASRSRAIAAAKEYTHKNP